MDLNALETVLQKGGDTALNVFNAVAPRLLLAVIIVILALFTVGIVSRIVASVGRRFGLRRNLIDVLVMLARVGIWLLAGLLALTAVFPTITPARALTTLGLGSVAVGFAFKDTFENFVAGILILLREPFQIGDYVECADVEGKIEEITIRDTRIRRTDGQLVVMPNHTLFHQPVTVRTDQDLRRTSIVCGIAYGENLDAARETVLSAVQSVDTVRDDVKDVQVFAKAFGESSIEFEVAWWTGSKPYDIRSSRDQVIAAIKLALNEADIEIPFPYRTLTVNRPLDLRMVDDKEPYS
ncbi:mechanosensitive ion channel [Ruegeria atlantica]|uniref:Small-conductance mechanosensitive channel n=1 Tax=Ruegeria atlantica TaxID=81569 RepID=A0AA90ZHS3_9RHOB|nr:mechanosensitive ion channel family protein [Ruegeria atlantica]NOE20819.1 mechanosensitive ion channel [Ruegeria atlantica]